MEKRKDGRNARTVANNKYNNKAYERINLVIKKGNKEKIKQAADGVNMSVNGFINDILYKNITDFEKMDGGSGSPD